MCGVARKTIEMLEVKMIRIKALADESGVKICLILIEVGCCELFHSLFSSMTLQLRVQLSRLFQGEADAVHVGKCCAQPHDRT